MKTVFIILISSFSCLSQNIKENYIICNNFASEAEYFFHEEMYDSAVYYYELGFEYASEPHPTQIYKYAKALWKIGERDKAIEVVGEKCTMHSIDTSWFFGLNHGEYLSINAQMRKNSDQISNNSHATLVVRFKDSLIALDQRVRSDFDLNDSIKLQALIQQDSLNAIALIEFTKKHGFPAGKNIGWHQDCSIILLHMPPEWFVENYVLLYNEVVKGNLEPWMLARGIDRKFTVEIGEDKINPYNRYWKESVINPFLMFYNCVTLGVSPYYDFNWSGKPKKTIHFEYYKENKKFYNTAFEYKYNNK